MCLRVPDSSPADAVGLLHREVVLDLEILLPPGREKDRDVVTVVFALLSVGEDLQLKVEVLCLSTVRFNLNRDYKRPTLGYFIKLLP